MPVRESESSCNKSEKNCQKDEWLDSTTALTDRPGQAFGEAEMPALPLLCHCRATSYSSIENDDNGKVENNDDSDVEEYFFDDPEIDQIVHNATIYYGENEIGTESATVLKDIALTKKEPGNGSSRSSSGNDMQPPSPAPSLSTWSSPLISKLQKYHQKHCDYDDRVLPKISPSSEELWSPPHREEEEEVTCKKDQADSDGECCWV